MPSTSLRILQWNVNGIGNKQMELKEFLIRRGIHVALLQESKLLETSKTPIFPGYTTLRVDRPNGVGGGGLLALVSKDIPFTHTTAETRAAMPVDAVRELLTLRLRVSGEDLSLANIYIPPASSCPRGYVADLSHLARVSRGLVVGDFNAHDPSWLFTQAGDPWGSQLLDQFERLVILNDPSSPTRLPFALDTAPTSPDISFVSPGLASQVRWGVTSELSSDHLPIVLDVQLSSAIQPRPPRALLNLRRADWPAFSAAVEEDLAGFDPSQFPSLEAAADHLTTVILSAGRRHIPAGFIRRYVPCFSREVKDLLRERRHLRSLSPTPYRLGRIRDLTETVSDLLKDDSTRRWREVLESTDYRTQPSKLWRVVRSLHSRQVGIPDTHEAILPPNSTLIPTPREQANLLVDYYSSISRLPHSPTDRLTLRRLRRLPLDRELPPEFSPAMVSEAIRRAGNSTARGPDGLLYAHLKHLDLGGVQPVTEVEQNSDTMETFLHSAPP